MLIKELAKKPVKTANKTPAKRTKTGAAVETSAKTERFISVRMYNVGFGDAFLVQIPSKERPYRILFDCGSIKANGTTIADVAKQIIEESRDGGTAHIDLVVATHRHRDHVSGFAGDAWSGVEVGEVWMPWTEDPRDPKAKKIRDSQSKLAAALTTALQTRALASPAAATSLQPIIEMVGNSLANEAAMNTLHNGFAGSPKRRFLPEENMGTDPMSVEQIPGVQFYILGPSRDEEVIRDMDPPKGGSYLALNAGLDAEGAAPEPFGPDWRYTPYASGGAGSPLSTADRATIEGFSDDLESGVAVALDKAVNGTSLMIVMAIGKAYLLFPGDAQWGTWNAALAVPDWQALLKKTAFYKVGHHGSHNATPKAFVETILPNDFAAMASTFHVDQWPNIPKAALMTALGTKTKKLVRSDQHAEVEGFTYEGTDCIQTLIPF